MSYCYYYKARVEVAKSWYFVAVLRSFEHIAFDRTFDVGNSIFEFFVPADMEPYFVEVMRYFQDQGLITDFQQLPNRYQIKK